MHLSFLKELFSKYTVELYSENGSEWAYIKNEKYDDFIKIYYDPEDFDIYCLVFATQHMHISQKEQAAMRQPSSYSPTLSKRFFNTYLYIKINAILNRTITMAVSCDGDKNTIPEAPRSSSRTNSIKNRHTP